MFRVQGTAPRRTLKRYVEATETLLIVVGSALSRGPLGIDLSQQWDPFFLSFARRTGAFHGSDFRVWGLEAHNKTSLPSNSIIRPNKQQTQFHVFSKTGGSKHHPKTRFSIRGSKILK